MADLSSPLSGVLFDLDGSGELSWINWTDGGRDGWLCEDRDGDGLIRSGADLFGTAGGFRDGYEKLGLRCRDGDGLVRGPELDGLLVWQDFDQDGRSGSGELKPWPGSM